MSTAPREAPAQTGEHQPGWVRRLWPYLMAHRRNLKIALGGALVGSGAQAVVPLIERQIVDNVILHHRSSLGPWLALLVGLGVVTFAAAYLRRYQGGRVALDVQYDLRNAMYEHLHELDFAQHDQMPTGQLVGRANSDSTLVQGLLSFFPIMSGNILLLLASLAIMLVLSPLLALVSLVVTPTLLVVACRMRTQVFPATWDGQQKEGDIAQIVDEDVSGVRVVKAFGQEQRELDRMVSATKTLYGSHMRAVRLQARYQPLLQAIPTLGQVAVLALGGWLALDHRITIGTFLAFSTYLAQLVSPARMFAGILTTAQQARAGVERIFELLDLRPAITDQQTASELAPLVGEIDFDHVGFTYPDGGEALRDFDLHIAPGETVALVGPSGSGKSTVLSLVARYFDVSAGAVRLDGHDVRDVTKASLRRQVGVVFDDSFLFSASVRSNIAFGRPEASAEEVESAARAAGAHEFIEQLPEGYETVVGERGLTLSGGQRQRIALARALLGDPRILLLDDATSAVDAKVEHEIHAALRDIMRGRTTLLVAHRRSTLHLADRIVVVDAGRVVDQGSDAELLERCALYRSMSSGKDETPVEVLAAQVGAVSAAMVKGARTAGVAVAPARVSFGPASLGPGLGGRSGGGRNGWRASLAPTPELLAKVAALRPIRDVPRLDLTEETATDGEFSLWRFLGRYRGALGLGLVLVLLDSLASLAGPYLVRSGINNGVVAGSRSALFWASAIFLAVAFADLVDSIAETFVTGRTAERLMLALRIRIWAKLQRQSLDYYEREMAGRIMTRMTTDVDSFETLLETGLLSAVVSFCTFTGVGIALFFLNYDLALATLGVMGPLAVATVVFRRKAARTYEQARDRIAAVNANFQESLSGIRETQAFVHEEASIARFRRLGLSYLEARVRAQRMVATYFPFVQFLGDAGDAIVLGVGAGLVASGHLSTGALIAFVLYLDLFFSPIQQLSQVFDSWQQTRVSVGRVGELMALETLTPEANDPVTPPRLKGGVKLQNVHFSYPTGRPGTPGAHVIEALGGIDLEIAPGEFVALVGETGAGKSTVVKLLARFYDPTTGAVLVDGVDLRDYDLSAYRRQLGYVPQEGFLFTGTIRDNIAYGRPDASHDEVEAAAASVGAHQFISELANGYETAVSERGRSLSAGQRQLIALARAELIDPAILLLDEATSNLDLVAEAHVTAATDRVARGRTTVVIAHRLQTARMADRIIVMADGVIAEQGTHDGLLAAGGRYAEMWKASDLGLVPT
ncbi:MAG: ABC transporter ATP-binding protein [Acidimicrobiales bacterium]